MNKWGNHATGASSHPGRRGRGHPCGRLSLTTEPPHPVQMSMSLSGSGSPGAPPTECRHDLPRSLPMRGLRSGDPTLSWRLCGHCGAELLRLHAGWLRNSRCGAGWPGWNQFPIQGMKRIRRRSPLHVQSCPYSASGCGSRKIIQSAGWAVIAGGLGCSREAHTPDPAWCEEACEGS